MSLLIPCSKLAAAVIFWLLLVGSTSAFHFHGASVTRATSSSTLFVMKDSNRRAFLSTAAALSTLVASTQPSNSFPFGDNGKDRIQKELCIVNLLRLQYWARTITYTLETSEDIDQRKRAYLEARLGAKAMVAKKQKVGGGASPRVFMLISLQITQCLDDLNYYAKNNKRVTQLKEDLIESLASIVEFDGLETTQDPSPRSSLTLGKYNDQKALFVRRMLSERITPLTAELVDYFGPDTRAQCEGYVRDYYPNELPPTPQAPEGSTDTPIAENKAVS